MKKLVLVLAIVFAGVMSANAQMWIGGGLGANIDKGYTYINLAPELGYVINDQWQAALGVDYSMTKYEGVDAANVLYLQPYVRYVGGTIGHKFSLFADLTGDFGVVGAKNCYAVMLQPGIAWNPTEKFTVAFRFARVGYDHGIYPGGEGFQLYGALAANRLGIYYNF